MNRRDPNASGRQPGGYRDEDNSWSSPRQAGQWQSEPDRQAGGGWNTDDDQQLSYFGDRERGNLEGRYSGDPRDEQADYRYRSPRSSSRTESRYRDRGERGYRFSGSHGAEYPSQTFDASSGNDFTSFTSDDYGGRDFYQSRGGAGGGLAPSDTYQPSYGIGSWSRSNRSNDYSSWREEGERRGFLQRAGDEVASWFGDEDAARRREQDHRGRGPSDYTRSDERIREDVNDTLTHDWRLDASSVRVLVKDGEVTLDGTVGSRQDKRRAEDLSDGVSGVRHVQNNLRLADTSRLSGTTVGGAYAQTGTTSATASVPRTGGSDT